MPIELSLGCKRYPWVEPLIDGTVEPTGVDLTAVDDLISPEYYVRTLHREEFDVAELSLGAYLAAVDGPEEYPVTAIPAFPMRRFRHSYLYVRSGSDVETPRDLHGRSVGMINWQFTGGLWARGVLADRYGLDLESVDWRVSRPEYVPIDVPDRYDVSPLGAGSEGSGTIRALERQLTEGEVDAVITPTEFRAEGVERLFPDAFERERVYYRETGIFPIHHVVAIHDRVRENHPWAPTEIYEAFVEALETWWDGFTRRGQTKQSPFAWGLEAFEVQRRVFDGNPWEHGLTDRNRANLNQAIEYATEQGVIDDQYAVEELFLDVGETG